MLFKHAMEPDSMAGEVKEVATALMMKDLLQMHFQLHSSRQERDTREG